MARRIAPEPPQGAPTSTLRHVVSFYETDAMGIVHHSNYIRFFEEARVQFLIEHDRPYTAYVEEGLHMPVTRVEAAYLRSCRFADPLDITCWVAWARSASLAFAYRVAVGGQVAAYGASDHAIIDATGRPVRFPESLRARLPRLLGPER